MTTETANARPAHRISAVTRNGKMNFRQPPTNAQRAGWADDALKAFIICTGCDCEDSLTDLLCDLMHWSDRAGLSFAEAFYSASFHYTAEVAEEDTP